MLVALADLLALTPDASMVARKLSTSANIFGSAVFRWRGLQRIDPSNLYVQIPIDTLFEFILLPIYFIVLVFHLQRNAPIVVRLRLPVIRRLLLAILRIITDRGMASSTVSRRNSAVSYSLNGGSRLGWFSLFDARTQ